MESYYSIVTVVHPSLQYLLERAAIECTQNQMSCSAFECPGLLDELDDFYPAALKKPRDSLMYRN